MRRDKVDGFRGTLADVTVTGGVLDTEGDQRFFTWHAVLQISLSDEPEASQQQQIDPGSVKPTIPQTRL